ncbi:DUF5687 family protein [Sungkyunkwania multivorans]|uniref:DUF5687 family protein n=1 Tax=Sungkyunkwania multivorans TaxID=1173618 RepID=A0ABW3CZ46_9FLAO
MMFKHFINLEWKAFFRSASLGKSLGIKIFMAFLAIYLAFSMIGTGAAAYFILKEAFPTIDPLVIVSKFLIFWIFLEVIIRYFMQKLPVMNVKPLLNKQISKNTITHYVLAKSGLSFYNFVSLFAFVPFGVVLITQGYHPGLVIVWLLSIFAIVLATNYLNFLVNKSNAVLVALLMLIAATYTLERFDIFPVLQYSGDIFYALYQNPIFVFIPIGLVITFYVVNFKMLKSKLYLDASLSKRTKAVETSDMAWTRRFGDMAPFLQQDLRLIWRNKRTKSQVFVSLAMIFYGLIFYTIPTYENMTVMKVFVGVFMTGIFVTNFGQFIPAWDSAHYSMMMSQNIPLRKYLESKYLLLSITVVIMFLLSTPYAYFGLDALAINFACALYNLGVCLPLVLFFGSFNKKRIDLDKSAFGNMQGASATQFLIIIPTLGIPMIIYGILSFLVSFEIAIITIGAIGVIAFAFRKVFIDKITELYRNKKYGMIAGFKQRNS